MTQLNNILESVREEDFVEYYLFPSIDHTKDNVEQERALREILLKAEEIVKKYTKEYLWHKDEFKLTTRTTFFNKFICDNGKTGMSTNFFGFILF